MVKHSGKKFLMWNVKTPRQLVLLWKLKNSHKEEDLFCANEGFKLAKC